MLPKVLLIAVAASAVAAAPAFCPVRALTTCEGRQAAGPLKKCTAPLWHGIDSLEVLELTPINKTALRIRNLNGTFAETVATVTIEPMGGAGATTDSDDDNPFDCFTGPTSMGANCTTRLSAYFSDVGKILTSAVLDACGTIAWMNGFGPYGVWTHRDLPQPSPPKDMCTFDASTSLYHEVGSSGSAARFFTLQSINASAVRVHSLNGSFPDTEATLFEQVPSGAGDKIALRASLFGGAPYRGIMRSNGDGAPGCCKAVTDKQSGVVTFKDCPVISWWADSGDRSCWETVKQPSESEGACTE